MTRGGLHWQARSHLAAGIRIEDADPRAEAEKRAEWRAPQRPTPCSPRAGRGAARTAQPENTNLLRSLPSPRARVFVRKRENERAGASEGGFHLVIGNEKGPEPEAAFGSCRGAPPTPPLLPDAPCRRAEVLQHVLSTPLWTSPVSPGDVFKGASWGGMVVPASALGVDREPRAGSGRGRNPHEAGTPMRQEPHEPEDRLLRSALHVVLQQDGANYGFDCNSTPNN